MSVERKSAIGTVVIMGGRADYIERYFETSRDLLRRGYSVVSFDWRGQGGSQRLRKDRRGYIRSFAQYEADLFAVMTQVVRPEFPQPHLALAHSTGGNILLRSLRKASPFKKAVVTSPLLEFVYHGWPPAVAKLLATLATFTGFGWGYLPGYKRGPLIRTEFPHNPLTSDQERWDRDVGTLETYPELGTNGPTFAWLRAAVKSNALLRNWTRRELIACPVLLVTAATEVVVDSQAAREFSERVPGVSFMQIEDAKHEILMEQDSYRQQFWAAFDSFVKD